MAKIYPHKQTIIITVICFLAVAAVSIYAYDKPASSVSKNASDQEVDTTVFTAGTSTNSDAWRSQFISSTTGQQLKNTANGTSSRTTNVTEALGMDFLSSFAALKQADMISNTDVVNQATNNIISADLSSITQKTYTAIDVRIIPTSKTSLNSYSASISDLLNSYSPSTTTSEFAIIQEFISNNDPTVLIAISPILKEQKRIMTGLLLTPVPELVLENDLALVNGISSLISASELLQVADTDPIKSLAGSSLHISGVQNVTDSLSKINKLLESNGVHFNFHWEILNSLLN